MEAARSVHGSCFHRDGDSFRRSTRDFHMEAATTYVEAPIEAASTEVVHKFYGRIEASWKYSRLPVEAATTSVEASMEAASTEVAQLP